MNPSTPAWDKALREAPDIHEVVTVFKRYKAVVEGEYIPRQRVIGRKIIARGQVLYSEGEDS